jgi:hypothetical protein
MVNLVLISPDFTHIKQCQGINKLEALIQFYNCNNNNGKLLPYYGDYLVYKRTSINLQYLGMLNQLYNYTG